MRLKKLIFALMLASTSIAGAAGAIADEHDSEAEHCVNLRSIDRTDVVSDYGILFYMRNDKIYLNKLPHRCPGLEDSDKFMYRTYTSQLCDLDIISVLDELGFGFRPGVSCGLGMFEPISAERAMALESGEELGH